MDEYYKLLETDSQLNFARSAIQRYSAMASSEQEEDKKTGHKRNIIAVDDNLRINYEMVKTSPGNFLESVPASTTSAAKNKAKKDQATKIGKLKTQYYKARLYDLNEKFSQKNGVSASQELLQDKLQREYENFDETPSLEQQCEWLTEIHERLVSQYKQSLQEEKKWFLKKELLLDANIKLDLFSSNDNSGGGIKFGDQDSSELCVFKWNVMVKLRMKSVGTLGVLKGMCPLCTIEWSAFILYEYFLW